MINIIDELTKITEPVPLEKEATIREEPNPKSVMNENDSETPQEDETKEPKHKSYVESVLNSNEMKVNFRALTNPENYNGCDVVLPRESVRIVHEKLVNTLYGYFLGDRVAYPVVEYFVRNNWKKFGVQKCMMNANGFFFFKFGDQKEMLNAMQGGPWIIRSQPLIPNEWSPSIKLEKKEVKTIQVWVKIHDVPIAAYTEDGLSLIATAIGVPKVLDSYTTTMCMEAWGRSSYARALIEISVEKELKEELVMAIPKFDGEGFITEKMFVEYEWSPHRCAHCFVFGHLDETCPKQVRTSNKTVNKVDADGYMAVKQRKVARKIGIQIPKPKMEYRPKPLAPNKDQKVINKIDKMDPKMFKTSNMFDVLSNDTDPFASIYSESGGGEASSSKAPGVELKDYEGTQEEEEEVVEVYNETAEFMVSHNKSGASTPAMTVSNG
ncbi:uncharacterized protein LOC110931753 [Helianthus annuus]|uniref:uncharacterized protein LOC110931753 n=1 Tax=Helianthus annuus TaxID=4232 RepID=UPI000B90A453|nr:uncharacterized protein LOC110931753 [Helianthus annuus]